MLNATDIPFCCFLFHSKGSPLCNYGPSLKDQYTQTGVLQQFKAVLPYDVGLMRDRFERKRSQLLKTQRYFDISA